MKEPTEEEERKRFWEWYGFYIQPDKEYPQCEELFAPDGEHVMSSVKILPCHYPPIDLNNLFKYAVPKYIDEKCFTLHIDDIEAFDYLCADWKEGILKTAENVGKRAYKLHFDLALFWAIYKVREGE